MKKVEIFKIMQIESLLQGLSKREMMLLLVLCFLLGFAFGAGLLFESAQNAVTEKKAQRIELKRTLLMLQNDIAAQGNLNMQDMEIIYKEIMIMEQKIAQQEEKKRLVLEEFGVYSLRELADVNFLYNVEIAQEKGQIDFKARGKYSAMFSFLESLQAQPRLSFFAMQLYPNPNTMDLVLYATLQNQED